LNFAVFLGAQASAFAQPKGIDSTCMGPYQRYLAAPGPKAFAMGTSRGCGWQVQTSTLRSMDDIRQAAVTQCSRYGDGCRVVETSQR
jgi:hypothetical protein